MGVAIGTISDRMKIRYPFYILGGAILMIGLGILIAHPPNPKIRYMGLFFIGSGSHIMIPISIIWTTLNTGRGYERAVTLGMIHNIGTIGALISANVFMLKEAPQYHTGFSTGMGLGLAAMTAATISFAASRRANNKRDRLAREGNEQEDGQATIEGGVEDLGSKHPDFRYHL